MKTITATVEFIFQVEDNVKLSDKEYVHIYPNGKVELRRPMLRGYEIVAPSIQQTTVNLEVTDEKAEETIFLYPKTA